MKRVFICSRYAAANAAEMASNIARADDLCRLALNEERCAPFAPHLFYPRWLDDAKPGQRGRGIDAGLVWLECADEVWVDARDIDGCSTGMTVEVLRADELGIPVRWLRR